VAANKQAGSQHVDRSFFLRILRMAIDFISVTGAALAGLQTDNFRLTSCWGGERLAGASCQQRLLHIIYKRCWCHQGFAFASPYLSQYALETATNKDTRTGIENLVDSEIFSILIKSWHKNLEL
jgi:hypothetical protein